MVTETKVRIEIVASVKNEPGALQTLLMRAAQTIDLGDDATVHRLVAEHIEEQA